MKHSIYFITVFFLMCSSLSNKDKDKFSKEIMLITEDTVKKDNYILSKIPPIHVYYNTYSLLSHEKEGTSRLLSRYEHDIDFVFIKNNIINNDTNYIYSNNLKDFTDKKTYLIFSQIYYGKKFDKAVSLVRLHCGEECGYYKLFVYERTLHWKITNIIDLYKY